MSALPLILLTAGEPAGVGPDLVLQLAEHAWAARLCVVADPQLLRERAASLGASITLVVLSALEDCPAHEAGQLVIWPVAMAAACQPGILSVENADYVLNTLTVAGQACLVRAADAVVTAPVHKAVLNDAGIAFRGHTEFFAELSGVPQVVMMLVTPGLRVALATTHLALQHVPAAITRQHLTTCLRILHHDLLHKLHLPKAHIFVAGLNPHAGEGGHFGREEIEVIQPVIESLTAEGLQLTGPLPADTMFTPHHLAQADAFLCMYHDQGLPVLKYKGFGQAANITLGLPFVRTSVDHGTALSLAGTGQADVGSLQYALRMAIEMGRTRV